jgi:tetratricopeptide (TPR) repeat protein
LILAACTTLESGGQFASGRRALLSGDNAAALAHFEQVAKRDPDYVAPFTTLQESIWTYLGRTQYQAGKLEEARVSLEKALSRIPDDPMAKLYLALTNLRRQTAQKTTPPFTLQDISFALRERVEPKRVAVLARERGVGFDLTSETEKQLRKAGADDFLLDEIRNIRADSAKKKSHEVQLSERTKALAAALTGIHTWLDNLSGTRSGAFWDTSRQIRSQAQAGVAILSTPQPDLQKAIAAGESVGQKLEEEIDLVRRDEAEEYRRQQRR